MGHYNDMSLSETRTTDDGWYDRKDYGHVVAPATPAAHTTSDLRIPRTSDILDRAADERERAERLSDRPAVKQFTRLIKRLPGTRLCWQLGTLHIDSTSGAHYEVTRAGCNCLNGTKSSAKACYHWALFNLLIDMLDTDAETLDQEAEYRPVAPRIVACRSLVWGRL